MAENVDDLIAQNKKLAAELMAAKSRVSELETMNSVLTRNLAGADAILNSLRKLIRQLPPSD